MSASFRRLAGIGQASAKHHSAVMHPRFAMVRLALDGQIAAGVAGAGQRDAFLGARI